MPAEKIGGVIEKRKGKGEKNALARPTEGEGRKGSTLGEKEWTVLSSTTEKWGRSGQENAMYSGKREELQRMRSISEGGILHSQSWQASRSSIEKFLSCADKNEGGEVPHS